MEGCYWIAIPDALPDKMARRDCDGGMENLYLSKQLENEECLMPYIGKPCPCCGRPIMVNEHSYDLMKRS